MPKMYSKEEREKISKLLEEAANEYLMEYGVKKTTVDMLVKKVGIPKGTFYLFYPNKEVLFFQVIMEIHNRIQEEVTTEFKKTTKDTTIDEFVDIIITFLEKAMNTCLMRMMIDQEIVQLMNRLPNELLEDHLSKDHDEIKELLEYINPTKEVDIEAFSGAFRAIFLTLAYKRGIGEDHYMSSIRMLFKGLLLQLK